MSNKSIANVLRERVKTIAGAVAIGSSLIELYLNLVILSIQKPLSPL